MAGKFSFQWPSSCVAFTDIEVHKEVTEQFGNSAAMNQQNWMILTRDPEEIKCEVAVKLAFTQYNLKNQEYSERWKALSKLSSS